MSPDTLPKRVFFCLLVIIIFIGFMTSGCHSVKWETFPDDERLPQNKRPAPLNPPTPQGVTVIKGSF